MQHNVKFFQCFPIYSSRKIYRDFFFIQNLKTVRLIGVQLKILTKRKQIFIKKDLNKFQLFFFFNNNHPAVHRELNLALTRKLDASEWKLSKFLLFFKLIKCFCLRIKLRLKLNTQHVKAALLKRNLMPLIHYYEAWKFLLWKWSQLFFADNYIKKNFFFLFLKLTFPGDWRDNFFT